MSYQLVRALIQTQAAHMKLGPKLHSAQQLLHFHEWLVNILLPTYQWSHPCTSECGRGSWDSVVSIFPDVNHSTTIIYLPQTWKTILSKLKQWMKYINGKAQLPFTKIFIQFNKIYWNEVSRYLLNARNLVMKTKYTLIFYC